MTFTPKNDFDHTVMVYIKLLAGSLSILDPTEPQGRHREVLDQDQTNDNRRQYVRSYRKVRRRVAALMNKEAKRRIAKLPQSQRERATQRLVAPNSVTTGHVNRYLADVVCMLVDGNLKRANSVLPSWNRKWEVVDMRKHVNRTYAFDTSAFYLPQTVR